MENIIEKLNMTIELINKRKELKERVNELQQYKNYFASPQISFKEFKKRNDDTVASVIHVISVIGGILFAILFVVECINHDSYENQLRRAFGSNDNEQRAMIYVILFLIFTIIDLIPGSIRRNKYRQYIQQDNQYRSMCQSKLGEYQKAVEELNSLEVYMGNPQICIIPKDYWDNALEISGYIRNGVVKTVEEAIRLLPPKTSNNIIFCQNCGTQNNTTIGFCVKCGQKLI